MLNFINLFNRQKINLAHYPMRMDYGTLNAAQRNAMDSILSACVEGKDNADIPEMTQAEFDTVVTHIGMHFGSDDICKNIALLRHERVNGEWRYYAKVNLGLYEQAKAYKAELDAWIDKALSTLNEGTTEYKLKQACRYIANHARYKIGTNEPLDLLDKGAMCGAYSMLFYKMATRLGVQAYICRGYVTDIFGTSAHAWNMVEIGGKNYFYDVTSYDNPLRLPVFLHSATGWGREYVVNQWLFKRKEEK